MEHDNSWALNCCILCMMCFVFGIIVGGMICHYIFWEKLEKAGISRLIEHETKIDGKVTTNWVEIVWKDGIKK